MTVNRFYVNFILKEVRVIDSRSGVTVVQENGPGAVWHFTP